MNYPTGTVLTPQKIRRQVKEIAYFENDADVGFHIEDYATATGGQGANYALFAANGNQAALLNVLTALNDIHGTNPDRYVVPSTFFNTTNYANQAAAEAAFLAGFKGINMLAPPKGQYELIPVAQECEVEFHAEAAAYIAGDLLTWVWDATAGHIVPNKFQKTTDSTKALARVVETAPILPKSGSVVRVSGIVKVGQLPF